MLFPVCGSNYTDDFERRLRTYTQSSIKTEMKILGIKIKMCMLCRL